MRLSWPRYALAALLAVAGFWLLGQLTVATWMAQEAQRRSATWASGTALWHWDFAQPRSIVPSGSHGLENRRFSSDGLQLQGDKDGVVSLSLALNDDIIPMAVIDQVVIDVCSTAPLTLSLLSVHPLRTWVTGALAANERPPPLRVAGLARTQAKNLLLRFEAAPGTAIQLRSLSLRNSRCETVGACVLPVAETAFQATPEHALALRDATRQSDPVSALVAGGRLGTVARWLATHVTGHGAGMPWVMALVLIGWIVHALRRRARGLGEHTPTQALRDLCVPIGCIVILLLAGWPARYTPLAIIALFALCIVALLASPRPPSPPWYIVGDARAWRRAVGFSLIAMTVTAPLLWLSSPPIDRDALSLMRYPVWAIVQQWLLIAAIMPRARQLAASPHTAALLGGLVFALLHAPNFALMTCTFLGGSVWAWLGLRDRALLPLATSHALLGLWLIHVAPSWLLRSAEIGGRYLMPP
ncbi:MAG TPA: CPBP family intramembrane glutamic endopeptidase [Chiayiivirga sp.]|nr:CPBP family intramembrane glutamic endopeptidase [Chiayiivirga sp.]